MFINEVMLAYHKARVENNKELEILKEILLYKIQEAILIDIKSEKLSSGICLKIHRENRTIKIYTGRVDEFIKHNYKPDLKLSTLLATIIAHEELKGISFKYNTCTSGIRQEGTLYWSIEVEDFT